MTFLEEYKQGLMAFPSYNTLNNSLPLLYLVLIPTQDMTISHIRSLFNIYNSVLEFHKGNEIARDLMEILSLELTKRKNNEQISKKESGEKLCSF